MSEGTSNIETEFLELQARNAWPALFQHIRSESSRYEYKCGESLKPQNKALNRYRDVSPFDHSRVVLQRGPCDYINANVVKVERAGRRYILTQGPLAETVAAFWLMVWEQESRAVLMLNKIVEKKQVKCHWYWPQAIGPEHVLDLGDVHVEYLEHRDRSHWAERTFRVTDVGSGQSRLVLQFHYTTWPDFGVPSSPTAFLEFLRAVRESGSLDESVGPAVIHCSAGIGRSGTFCLVDSCLVLIEREGLNAVSVRDILLEMRRYRMGLIQTPDQLRFSYQAIIEGAKNSESSENQDEDEPAIASSCSESEEEEEEAPPLPPPRGESLLRSAETGCIVPERPLPTIPASESAGELLAEAEITEDGDQSPPPNELRHRKREERRDKLTAQLQDMKRKQRAAEHWTQLKRSLCATPLLIAGAALAGGLAAYFYFRS